MTSAANPVENFAAMPGEDPGLKKFLIYSLFLHFLLAAGIVASIFLHYQGNLWGGVGGQNAGSVNVKLVGNMGIPMPNPPEVTQSTAVDPTNGLHQEEPQPKPPAPPKDSTAIPEFKNEKRPQQIQHPSQVPPVKTPQPPNAVPYGQGGRPQIPTGYGQTPGAAQGAGSVTVQGQGGGDFAARYAWYVDAVIRRIRQNWDQTTIDPAVRSARAARCETTFTIQRDGTVSNIQLTQSSGNLSMDNSARRALLSSTPMPGLPPDYSGSYVNVTFDFDLGMNH